MIIPLIIFLFFIALLLISTAVRLWKGVGQSSADTTPGGNGGTTDQHSRGRWY